jgi:hypothetical protein
MAQGSLTKSFPLFYMGQDVGYSRPFGGSLQLMLFNNPFVTEAVDLLLAYTSEVA